MLFALSLVCSIAWSESPDKKTDQGQQTPTGQAQGTKESPVFIQVVPTGRTQVETKTEKSEAEEKASLDRKIVEYTRWLAIVTTVLAVFTAFLWWATQSLVRDAKETSKRQLRAYVHCAEVPVQHDVRAQIVLTGNIYFVAGCRITIRWENAGLTPARDCTMWTSYRFWPVEKPLDLSFRKDSRSDPIRLLLGPKGNISSIPIAITLDQMVNLFEKKARAFIWGLCEYRDIFSKENGAPNHTEVCLEIVVDVDPRTAIDREHPPVIVAFQGIATHNSAS